jgi:hypothetical protein
MTRRAFVIAVVLGLAGLALAQKKEKKPVFPAWIKQASYVYVTTIYGDPFSASMGIPPEDRKAALDVQEALKKWGRFILVYRPDEADIILVTRKSTLAAPTVGGRTTGGLVFGAEAGNPDDALLVYEARLGTDRPAALKYIEKNGLDAPELKLVAEFRKQVEEASVKKP